MDDSPFTLPTPWNLLKGPWMTPFWEPLLYTRNYLRVLVLALAHLLTRQSGRYKEKRSSHNTSSIARNWKSQQNNAFSTWPCTCCLCLSSCRVGRVRIMMFTSLCQFVLGVSVAFSGNYYMFIVLRFLLAMVSSAVSCVLRHNEVARNDDDNTNVINTCTVWNKGGSLLSAGKQTRSFRFVVVAFLQNIVHVLSECRRVLLLDTWQPSQHSNQSKMSSPAAYNKNVQWLCFCPLLCWVCTVIFWLG